jgi:flagellar hook-associated protein 2
MGTISSGTGLFSGIDSASIIQQLMAIEARPKILAQRRIADLQRQQAAYLDLNAKLQAVKSAAAAFRVNSLFQTNKANSTRPEVLSATASTSATPGSYSFLVDRMVSTQQFLSRGFSDANATGLAAGTFRFEPAAARLDRDTSLADLNGGAGIERGKIVISHAGGGSATIDLSRAATVNDVLDAINSAGPIDVTASVEGGRFVIRSNDSSNLTITSAFGYNTAASLGVQTTVPASTVTGSVVYALGNQTALTTLNDGNGIFRNSQSGASRYDFTITVTNPDGSGSTAVQINIGNIYNSQGEIVTPAPTTVGAMLTRINDQLAAAMGDGDLRVTIAADGGRLRLVDAQDRTLEVAENPTASGSTTAADLGLKTSGQVAGPVEGKRILAGLNTTLARTLNGGSGIAGNGTIAITGRDGQSYTVSIDTGSSLAEIIGKFATDTAGKITARLNRNGTGLEILDLTGGSGNLVIGGSSAASLGIATDPAGIAAGAFAGSNLQHQYITLNTALSSVRGGQGVGTGTFRITDSTGSTATVTLGDSVKNFDDLIRLINSRGIRVKARINAQGDGLQLYEDAAGAGTLKIKVEDVQGSTAANLNLKGEATGTGADNTIDGSFERKVTFAPADTLQQIAAKITAAGVGINAAVINDGAGSSPYRLSLTARNSGQAGRMVVDSGLFDLGLTNLDEGNDARVFFGGTDPARAVLLSSSRNTLDNVVTGVTIDLNSVSADPVTLTVTRDTGAVETALATFVDAFNQLTGRVAAQTKYDKDAQAKAPLLGDSTALNLGSALFSTVQRTPIGVGGNYQRLTQVGIDVGKDGKLEFNRDRFRQALQDDPQAVQDLIAAYVQEPPAPIQLPGGISVNNPDAEPVFTKLGVMGLFERLGDSYINSVSGILTKRGRSLTDQIEDQTRRIASLDVLLANKQQRLQRQFLAMEQAIGRLQSQQAALSRMNT